MYKISIYGSNGLTVIYDQAHIDDYDLTEPELALEIGQPGSLKFTLLPSHPSYNEVKSMETYVIAERDSVELFYGRVVDTEIDKTNNQLQVQCAGALNFLDDIELAPISNTSMTGEAFLRRCITEYNAGIQDDPKRAISVGTISSSRASTSITYGTSSYQKIKQALDSYLINEFGGFLRIRKNGNQHVIDWIDDFGIVNSSPIELGENVQSQQNAISSGELYTMIRPTGKNGIRLDSDVVPVSNELVAKYGRIIRGVKFANATTKAQLQTETDRYLSRIGKGVEKICTVKLIDMHFLDNSEPSLDIGATYTNIVGFENETLTASGIELHFDNPAEDSVVLKNKRALVPDKTGSASGRSGGGGSRGSQAKTFANMYEHIQETETDLRIHADLIELNGKQIEIHGEQIQETAEEFERYSAETTQTIERHEGLIEDNQEAIATNKASADRSFEVMRGTATYQNADHIAQVAGMYSVRYRQVPASKLAEPGRNPKASGYYQWNPYYQAVEADVGTGAELFWELQDAKDGKAVLNSSKDNTNVVAGTQYGRMEKVTETSVIEGKTYYTRTIGVYDGAESIVEEEGVEINVGNTVLFNKENVQTIMGSSLWVQRNAITGVTGEFEIVTDPSTGVRTLVIKSGGGMKIERNGVQYGLYDAGNLTGGLIVSKINDNSTLTKIIGSRVDIEASQVRIGSTSNVETWMNSTDTWKDSTDDTLDNYAGLIADRATIAQLNAQKARIDSIEADYVAVNELSAQISLIDNLVVQNLGTQSLSFDTGNPSIGSYLAKNLIKAVQIVSAGNNTYKLQIQRAKDSEWSDVSGSTFSRATSLSGAWSGTGRFTVTATPQGETLSRDITHSAPFRDTEDNNRWKAEVYAYVPGTGTPPTEEHFGHYLPLYLYLQDKTGVNKITSNGTYSPTGSIMGYSAVEVDVAGGTTSLSGAWSSGTYTVTASPQGSTNETTLQYLSPSGNVSKSGKVVGRTFKVQYGVDSDHLYDTGFSQTVSIDASGVYDDGYAAAKVSGSWTGATYTATKGTTGDNSVSTTVGAGASISYNTSTHKYTATGSANVGTTLLASTTASSGTEAYDAGVTAGNTAGYNSAKVSGSWSNGVYTATKGTSGSDSASTTLQYLSPSGNVSKSGKVVSRTFKVQYGVDSDHLYDTGFSQTASIDASGVYDDGYAAAKVSGSWSGATYTATKGTSGSNSVSTTVSAGASISYNTSTHKYTATGSANVGTTLLASTTASSGTEAYDAGVTAGNTAGYNSAKVSGSWSGATYTATKGTSGSNSVSTTVSAGASISYNTSTHKYTATGSANVGTTLLASTTASSGTEAYDAGVTDGYNSARVSGSWSGTTYTATKGTTGGNSASTTVNALASITYDSTTHKYTATGSARTGTTVLATSTSTGGTEAYEAGWGGCLSSVGLNSTEEITLNPGGAIYVYAQAKANPTSTSKSNIASRKVKARDLSLQEKSVTSNGYVTADSSYDGLRQVSVNVDTTTPYNNGWTGCYNTVGIYSSTTQISAGNSVTVYAQAKSSSSASSKSNVASVTISALNGSIPSSNIQIGNYSRSSSSPAGTLASNLAANVRAAITNKQYLQFRVYIQNTSPVVEKYYVMNFTS